jgi:ribosomal protein S21
MHPDSKKFKSMIPGKPGAIAVNGDIVAALRTLKRQTKQSNLMVECYERRWFDSVSKTKRLQREKAKYIQSVKDLEDGTTTKG